MLDFTSLGLSEVLVRHVRQYGIYTPTPIQARAIPAILKGSDLIAQAQTGTGKTLAYLIPILEKINPDSGSPSTLIVTPTRELALQITEEMKRLLQVMDGINILAIYGGQDVEMQMKLLQSNVHIAVGTPGRLLDHIRRGTLDLSRVDTLVIDEADQMLHIGFINEVEQIILETPPSRQTLLFSATMPMEIREIANKYLEKPEYIQVEKVQGPAVTVKQIAIHTTDRTKQEALIRLIRTYRPFLGVIFCRTKRRVTKLYEALAAHHFTCDELHGDLSQTKREEVMKRFREVEIQYLIATDVAARGLDVEGVTHVFNYDIPHDSESYIHRIGRTGRAGTKGIAITLYSSKDRSFLDLIEKELNITIPKQNYLDVVQNVKNKPIRGKEQKSNTKLKKASEKKGRKAFKTGGKS